MLSGRNLAIGLTFLLALALGAAGCGSSGEVGDGTHPDYERALAGAPAPLAALYEQGNQILPGGRDAYEQRIEELRGFPVVVNVWSSWCGPCRFEFPVLQDLSARYGKRVAFLGVDFWDETDAAETFLRDNPVPYPSYEDGDKEIGDSLGGRGVPRTAFYSRDGALCYLKSGPYPEERELEADVRRYALGGECPEGA